MKKLLQDKKNKALCWIFIVELIVAAAILVTFFIPSKTYIMHPGDSVKLPYGHYYLICDYEVENGIDTVNFMHVEKTDGSVKGIVQGEEDFLSENADSLTTEFWLNNISSEIRISVREIESVSESDSVQIEKYTIEATKYTNVIVFFITLLIIGLTWLCLCLKSGALTLTSYDIKKICLFMFVLLISSIPLFNKKLLLGWDLEIHLARIEGMMQGFKAGQIPVRVEPAFNGGYGYAFSTYYGGLFYNVAAIARWIGFSIQNAYKIYVVFINIATILISYYCFRIMFDDDRTAVFGSIIYSLSLYRIFDLYQRGAVGEYTAITFMPLIAAGLWRIYTCPPEDVNYKRFWILPVLGYTGIIQSHILSTEISGMFTVLLCLVMFKKTFRKNTFIVLLKIVIYTVILNLWFLYPFFENYLFEDTVISSNIFSKNEISNDISLLSMFKYNFDKTESWYNVLEAGIGPILGITLIMFIYAIVAKKAENTDKKRLIFIAVFAVISIIISASVFPWNGIIRILAPENIDNRIIKIIFRIARSCIVNIQYAFRFMIVSSLFVTIIACILYSKRDRLIKYAGYLAVALAFVQTIYSGISFQVNGDFEKYLTINENNYGLSSSLGNMEYIPLTAEGNTPYFDQFYNMHYCYTTNAEVTSFSKKYTNIYAHVVGDNENIGIVEFPLLYYRGYRIVDVNTGKEFQPFKIGNNARLGIITEPGYEGDIRVYYAGEKMWHVMDVISLVFFIAMIAYIAAGKKIQQRAKQIYVNKK